MRWPASRAPVPASAPRTHARTTSSSAARARRAPSSAQRSDDGPSGRTTDRRTATGYTRHVPSALYLTESDEANELLAQDPLALLIGFALDQQVTVPTAFAGPLKLEEPRGRARCGAYRRHGSRRARSSVPRAPGDPPLPRLDGPARAGAVRRRRRRVRRQGGAGLDRSRRTAPTCASGSARSRGSAR